MPAKTYAVNFVTKGFSRVQKRMKKTGRSGRSMGKTLRKGAKLGATAIAGIATAAAGAVAGLGKLVSATADYAREVDNASEQSGVSAERIQEIAYAAKQTSGASFDNVRDGLKELALRSAEAAEGTGEAQEAFQRLGISQEQLASMSTAETFSLVQERMKGLTKQQRILTAEQVFGGEAGEKFAETMGLSAEEMQKLSKEARATGSVLSGQQVKALEKTRAAWSNVKTSIVGLGRQIAVALLPLIERLTPLFQSAVKQIQGFLQSLDGERMKGFVSAVVDGAKRFYDEFRGYIDLAVDAWEELTEDLAALWDTYGDEIIRQSKRLFSRLQTLFDSALRIIAGLWDAVIGTLTGDWDRAWGGIKDVLLSAVATINALFYSLIEQILTAFQALASKIPGIGDTMAAGLEPVRAKVQAMKEEMEGYVSAQQEAADGPSPQPNPTSGGSSTEPEGSSPSGGRSSTTPYQPRANDTSPSVQGASGGVDLSGTDVTGPSQKDKDWAAYLEAVNAKRKEVMQASLLSAQRMGEIVSGSITQMASGLGTFASKLFSINDGFSSIGEAIKSLGSVFGSVFKSLIKQIITTIAKMAILKGLMAILGPVGGVGSAGGSVIGGALGLTPMAAGGIVSGPTPALVGEYPGAKSNPEVVAPLSKLKGMIGGSSNITVNVTGETRTRGTDLYTAYNATTRAQRRKGHRSR
jgi:hypothetical protein